MFGTEIGQFPAPTNEIKPYRRNNMASRNAVFYGVLSSAEFFDHTVLLGPKGVYVITAGTLSPEPLAELGEIGMKLIESQKKLVF